MFAWLFGSNTRAPVLLEFRSSKTFIIVVVTTAIFTDLFVYAIVVPVLPFALSSRVGVDPKRVQTWISIFLAVFGAALLVAAPICGWAADRTKSRKWPMICGLLALAGSTVLLMVGPNIGVLAVGRALQGVNAAVIWVVGLALLVDTVGPEEIGYAMGYVSVSISVAMVLAPLLGGIVFAKAGYYSVWAMAFGLFALDLVLRVVMIEKKVAAKWLPAETEQGVRRRADVAGTRQPVNSVATSMTRMSDFTSSPLSIETKKEWPELVSPTTSSFVDEAPGQQQNAMSRLKRWTARLPPVVTLLGSRRILSAIFACTVQAALLTAFDSILPIFVRDTFHWDSIGAGLVFLPIVIPTVLGPIVGTLSDKHGPRWYATTAYLVAGPFLILLRLVHENTLKQKVLLCALLALLGFCFTLMLTPMMAEITYAVDAKAARRPPGYFGKNGAYAQAYSLFNVAWALGCLIGPLLGGLVKDAYGWNMSTLILAVVSMVTAVPTVIWTGGSLFKKRKRKENRRQEVEVATSNSV